MTTRPRIAHLAGPTATIQNTPPLVTSNKARAKYGLAPRTNLDGTTARFDALRGQRLAAPATIYVEAFSAHPLEADAARLYAPPDGYLDAAGQLHATRQSAADKPVYAIEIRPEDGLYPLPYMARQHDGAAWEEECAQPGASEDQARQGFFPDGSRSFEEIDRFELGADGTANQISAKADIDFFRILPPSGFTQGLPAEQRRDVGDGAIAAERRGVDFFPYKPFHLPASPPPAGLARAANAVQKILASGKYTGAIWTEGSPTNEETLYWLHLVVDTTLPICGNSAQRPQGQMSHDGPKNIVDSTDYIASRVWADADGNNRAGAVMIQEQQIFAARAVTKVDARPGGYIAAGGHGGVLGAAGHDGAPLLHYVPTLRHTHLSALNITRLPKTVEGVRRGARGLERVTVPIKGPDGFLLDGAIPKVAITKDAAYWSDDGKLDLAREVDLVAMIEHMLTEAPLAGFVIEGLTPYGSMTSNARNALMRRAVLSGIPAVRVGRGHHEGFVPQRDPYTIAGSNLASTKARMLLLASLMRLGSLPPCADPDHPRDAELAAIRAKVAEYQEIFDTH
jgi:L-asparaginase